MITLKPDLPRLLVFHMMWVRYRQQEQAEHSNKKPNVFSIASIFEDTQNKIKVGYLIRAHPI